MTEATAPTPASVTFAVPDMSCQNCVNHIEAAIRQHFPAATAAVDLANKQVTVGFDPASTSREAIAKVLEDEGYPAS